MTNSKIITSQQQENFNSMDLNTLKKQIVVKSKEWLYKKTIGIHGWYLLEI